MGIHQFNAQDCEKAFRHWHECGRTLLGNLELTGDEHILDIGCGCGELSEELAQRVPQGSVLGIDFSDALLKCASARRQPNLRFERMEVSSIRFREEFDLIFSNSMLHWVRDHEPLLFRLRRALRPGGQLRFSFAAEGHCGTFCYLIQRALHDLEYRDFFDGFPWPWYTPSREEYEAMLWAAGFSEFHVTETEKTCCFESPDELLAWLDSPVLSPFLRVLPEALRDDFRDDVAVSVIERCRKPGGTYYERFRHLNVTAKK